MQSRLVIPILLKETWSWQRSRLVLRMGKSTVLRNLTGGIGAGTTEFHVIRPVLVNAEYILLFLKMPSLH